MSRRMLLAYMAGAGLAVLAASPVAVAGDVAHTVLAGENPWSISARYLRSMDLWPRLVKYNRIADPLHIAPGTVLQIPEGWLARRSVPARVLAVEGRISLTDARGRQSQVSVGDTIPEGAVLRTGAQDSLSLGLLDNSRVLVKSDSEIRLDSNAENARGRTRSILLDLRRGALESDVEKRSSSGGRFEIRTPAGIAAVRGTAFRVVASDTRTSTEVLAGAVKLQNRAGAAELAAGFASSVTARGTPEPPRPLLPAPELTGLPQRIERVPSDLPIAALPGASAYRTQIADRRELCRTAVRPDCAAAGCARARPARRRIPVARARRRCSRIRGFRCTTSNCHRRATGTAIPDFAAQRSKARRSQTDLQMDPATGDAELPLPACAGPGICRSAGRSPACRRRRHQSRR